MYFTEAEDIEKIREMSINFLKVFGNHSDLSWKENKREMCLLSPKFKIKVYVDARNEFEKLFKKGITITRAIGDYFIEEKEWLSYIESENSDKKTPYECLKPKCRETFDAIIGILKFIT